MTQLNKDIIKNLTYKYFKTKYQGNIIGFLWSFITPSVLIFAYYFAFTYILKVSSHNHLLYLIGAVIHWRLFSTSFPSIANSFVSNKDILQKININRILVPFSVFTFNISTFLIMLIVFIILFPLIGGKFSGSLLVYPIFLLLYCIFIFGIGIMMATVSARFRDIPHMIEVVLMLAFWFTPIIYNYHRIPDELYFMIYINPFATFIVGMEQIFYDSIIPTLDIWVSMILWSSFAIIFGYYMFKKNEYKALDVL
jgi:ABC-type polysaccharide/polyol phosphate export permease